MWGWHNINPIHPPYGHQVEAINLKTAGRVRAGAMQPQAYEIKKDLLPAVVFRFNVI